MSTTKEQL